MTTILPDGSAFNTATIMSREEAMKLPIAMRPICFRVSEEIYTATFENMGAASMCWNPKPSTEVFDAELCSNYVMKLLFKIAQENEERALASYKQGRNDAANLIRKQISTCHGPHDDSNPCNHCIILQNRIIEITQGVEYLSEVPNQIP